MKHYIQWTDLPELIRTSAIYRNYLNAMVASAENKDFYLNRYLVLQLMLVAYPVDELMPEFYQGLHAAELEVLLQFHGVDVDQI
jgi:hypothetical protein